MYMHHTVSKVPIHECTRHLWPEVKNSALKDLKVITPVFVDIGKKFGCHFPRQQCSIMLEI